jgi:hypothetical protein
MVSVLDPINPRSYASTLLLLQLQLYNKVNLARDQKAINANLTQKINSINLTADKWRSLKTNLLDTVNFISEAVTRAESMQSKLEDMSGTAYSAKYGDATSSWTYPIQFDVKLRGINSQAIDSTKSPNLLGPNDSNYTYITNTYGATDTVSRQFLGTDYTITDTGGNIWVRDRSGFILRQYDASYVETGNYAALTGGIRLDTISGSTVTFTINYNSTSAQQFTGTLATSGLGLLDAWLYDDLKTSAGRDRALTDVHQAQAEVNAAAAQLKGKLAMAQYNLGRASLNVTTSLDAIDATTKSHMLQLQKVEAANGQQNALSTMIVNGANNTRNEYLNLLQLSYGSGLSSALIDILA